MRKEKGEMRKEKGKRRKNLAGCYGLLWLVMACHGLFACHGLLLPVIVLQPVIVCHALLLPVRLSLTLLANNNSPHRVR